LRTLKIDQLGEKLNDIDLIAKSNIEIKPSEILSKAIYYVLMLIIVLVATDFLGMAAVSNLVTDLLNYIPQLFVALIVFVVGSLIADFLKNIVKTACESLNIPAANLISNFVFYFLLINVIMVTLKQANIYTEFIRNNISIILAGVVFAFAIGYGFASKSLLANMLASFYNKEKVQVGNVIDIEGVKGTIIEIDNNSLTIQGDGRRTVVPLHKLTTEKYDIIDE